MNITDKAMLADVTIRCWEGRKFDREVSNKVASDHGTTATKAGNYNKMLVAKEALDPITKARNAIKGFHYTNTLPWMNNGARILPAANFFAYSDAMRDHRAVFDNAVAEFVRGYDGHVRDARSRLNSLFRIEDYPAVAAIERAFSIDLVLLPLPDASDWRVQLSQDESDRIRAEITARCASGVNNAMGDLWSRVHENVGHMAERLRAYSINPDTGKASGTFKDSLVGNLRDLAELLPRLNVTGDPQLAEMHKAMVRDLCAHEPQTLRDDDKLRSDVASAAEAMLASMAGVMAAA